MASAILIFVTVSSFIVLGNTANVQFFSEPNFTGYTHDITSTNNCTDLQFRVNGSVKTSECIVLSSRIRGCQVEFNTDCDIIVRSEESKLTKMFMKVFLKCRRNHKNVRKYFGSTITSIRDCTLMEKSHTANLDFYKMVGGTSQFRFREICGCTNIPPGGDNSHFAVKTFGKCFTFYTQPNCMGNLATTYFYESKIWGVNAYSFKPCEIPNPCIRLQAHVYQLLPNTATNMSRNSLAGLVWKIPMSNRQTVINNGLATMKDYYISTVNITESATLELFTDIQLMSSISFEPNMKFRMDKSISIVESFISKLKRGGSGLELNQSSTRAQRLIGIEKTKMFKQNSTIHTQICTKYDIASFVELVEDAELYYNAKAKITFELLTNETISLNDIKTHLKNHDIAILDDDNGDDESQSFMFVETYANIKTTYVEQTMINVNGDTIHECLRRFNRSSC